MNVRPQLGKAKIGLTMKQFFCTVHLFLNNRHKTNKLDPIFKHASVVQWLGDQIAILKVLGSNPTQDTKQNNTFIWVLVNDAKDSKL